jgi:restriction system protein
MNKEKIPTYDQLMNPLIKALKLLGGSGTIDEINEKVFEIENIPQEIINIPHGKDGSRSEVEYRLAWTRTYLKSFGLLENSRRGVWAIVADKSAIDKVDPKEVVTYVRSLSKTEEKIKSENDEELDSNDIDAPEEVQDWRHILRETLLNISPDAFERLVKRILRESGFYQVEVTGKTSDGGIDGKGIFRIAGFISFNVLFQCKRYRNTSITSSDIRDFRGALQGRADKGLFITTSTFTRDAIKESSRDGAPPIDLIDGEALIDKLKELKLGMKIELIEKVEIQKDWYNSI